MIRPCCPHWWASVLVWAFAWVLVVASRGWSSRSRTWTTHALPSSKWMACRSPSDPGCNCLRSAPRAHRLSGCCTHSWAWKWSPKSKWKPRGPVCAHMWRTSPPWRPSRAARKRWWPRPRGRTISAASGGYLEALRCSPCSAWPPEDLLWASRMLSSLRWVEVRYSGRPPPSGTHSDRATL